MIKEKGIRLGPLALLLSVVAIALSTLATLSFSSARADMIIAERFASTVKTRYALDKEGQEYRSNNEGDYTFETEISDYVLKMERSEGREYYHIKKIWNNDESVKDLWEGN
ncbi:MAG: hypothetical protein IKE38_02895 [Erysipelotrichaceae bacterium]|nr:hypothetical protein [Erysipelotrichaceae bacterium]